MNNLFADEYDSEVSSNGEFEQDFSLEHFNEIFDNDSTSDIDSEDSEDFEDFNESDFDKNEKDYGWQNHHLVMVFLPSMPVSLREIKILIFAKA